MHNENGFCHIWRICVAISLLHRFLPWPLRYQSHPSWCFLGPGGKKSGESQNALKMLSFGPLLDKKKFPDFKSLWRMWRSWMYLRARMAWPCSKFWQIPKTLFRSITAVGEAWVNHRTTWSCGKIFEEDLACKSIGQTFAKHMNSLTSPALRSWFCQPGRRPHSSPWRYIASHPLRNIDRIYDQNLYKNMWKLKTTDPYRFQAMSCCKMLWPHGSSLCISQCKGASEMLAPARNDLLKG